MLPKPIYIYLHHKTLPKKKGLIVPYLWATQAPFSTAVGGYEALEYTISKGLFPLLALGTIFLTAITVGRVFCGWACPVGLIQDLLSYLPFKKHRKLNGSTESSLRITKIVVVSVSLLTALLVGLRRNVNPAENPLDVMSDGPFSMLSPAGTIFAYIPWMFLWKYDILSTGGLYVWLKLIAIVAFIVSIPTLLNKLFCFVFTRSKTKVPSLYIPRFFCRYICPMAPILGSVSAYKLFFKVHRKPVSVDHANSLLENICPTGVRIRDPNEKFITSPNCIHCGNCVAQSPGVFYTK